MKRLLFVSCPAAAVIVVLLVSGCTPSYLIMEGISASSDHELVPGRIADIADAGVTDIAVVTDSTVVSGTFAGLRIADPSNQHLLWEEWAKASGLGLRRGDSIGVRRSELLRGIVRGRFATISEGEIIIRDGSGELSVRLSSIMTLERDGSVWTGNELREILKHHVPPSDRALLIATAGGDTVSVPLDAVKGGIYRRTFSLKGVALTIPLDLVLAAFIAEGIREGIAGGIGR